MLYRQSMTNSALRNPIPSTRIRFPKRHVIVHPRNHIQSNICTNGINIIFIQKSPWKDFYIHHIIYCTKRLSTQLSLFNYLYFWFYPPKKYDRLHTACPARSWDPGAGMNLVKTAEICKMGKINSAIYRIDLKAYGDEHFQRIMIYTVAFPIKRSYSKSSNNWSLL